MAERPAPLRIARLRVRASSAEAARAIAAEFGGAMASVPAPAAQAARRVSLEAGGEAGGRGAARALGALLGGGRDG